MSAFTMWEEKIVFVNGWFIYMDGKGNNSVISHKRARMLELGYQQYQASMDINRGGAPDEVAYPSRGFVLKDGKYVYENFRVDRLIDGEVNQISSVLKIPEIINGITINCVAREAFKDETTIATVILHDDIRGIGESAFAGCNNLSHVSLSNKLIEIKRDAFKDTLLCVEGITYLNNVLVKVEPDFRGTLVVKEGTLAIADGALSGCAEVTEIELPEGLISIGRDSFKNCSALRRLVLPESVQMIGEGGFSGCTCLAEIKLPATMEKIGAGTFKSCEALASAILPEGIDEIERGVFYECKNLKHVNIPVSVTEIGFDTFDKSGLFLDYANSNSNELYIDNWLIHYKSDNLTSLCVKEGTIGIANMDWSKPKKIQSVCLPESLKYIGDDAFNGALIKVIDVPKNLIRIGKSAFRETELQEVCIPGSVETIGDWAFMRCKNIKKIVFEGAKTNISGTAITGRKDGEPIIISAPLASAVNKYCTEYGKRENLIFKPRMHSFIKKFFKK